MSEFKVVSFIIGDEEYALDIMKIDSIIEIKKILSIPQSPPFVEGVINFRGTVVPVINGRKKFLIKSLKNGDKRSERAIVVNFENKKVAILVDEVKEVLTLSQNTLEEPPSEISDVSNEYISAIANIDGRMIIILDAGKILNRKESSEISNMVKKESVEGR